MPNRRMITPTATVKVDGRLERSLLLEVRYACDGLYCGIVVGDVRLVMLLVMEDHDLLADVWLEPIVWVWEIWEFLVRISKCWI